ncbi:MAG: glycosyl hydrolase family 95 catalytic domain-containing protein [Phocaeicola sp.]
MKRQISMLFLAIIPYIGMAENLFKVDKDYFRKYDIVYLDPDYEGYNGFPLGNGDLGGLIWTTERGVELQLNKINLYDQPKDDYVSLRSAGRVSIDFGVPSNDYIYLSDFENRLSLLDAEARLKSETAFIKTDVKSWVDAHSNVWVIECDAAYSGACADGSEIEISLERWGSRHFGDWYNSRDLNVANGLGKTKSAIKNKDIVISESFEGGLDFSVVCRVVDADQMPRQINNHKGVITQKAKSKNKFYVLVSVVTSEEHNDPTSQAIKLLDNMVEKGVKNVNQAHQAWWHNFWDKSFVNLSEDYIENIYYLRRYLTASSSRGNYPIPFNGGLWVWNHDHRQWTSSVHWNTQQSYWGLAEQNDADLMKPYIDTYFRLMPFAEKYTFDKYQIKDAIAWTEVHDFVGNMLHGDRGDMKYNFTPASQIASVFWNYYEFTEDKVCLRDTIYPFIKKAAEFYLNKLEWDAEKSQYFIYPAQPYEHPYTSDLKNPTTDRYMIESLFRSCIKAANILSKDKDKVKQWTKVVNNLWEPPVLDVPEKGKVFVMAYKPNGEVYPNMDTYYKRQFYHCDAHTTMVFPGNVLGLDQRNTEYFNIAKNIALNHPADRNAITPGAIVSARLGLGDKVMERLGNVVSYLQHFNQGLFYNIDHWHVLSRYDKKVENSTLMTQRDYVFDSRSYYGSYAGNSGLWAKPFVQCGMEPITLLGTAVNEMLLQSQEGKIRVFPALPSNRSMAFTLMARGAFKVSSYISEDGKIPGVEIESLNGNSCRIQNPWSSGKVEIVNSKGNRVTYKLDKEHVISFNTAKNETYTIKNSDVLDVNPILFRAEQNNSVKKYGEATLGKERTFIRNK